MAANRRVVPAVLGQVTAQAGGRLRIDPETRLTHMHVIGATGTGKSKFLEMLIRQDIDHGHGICVLDPHGDLYTDIMKYCIDQRLHQHVIPLNPSDDSYVVGFNPFLTSYQSLDAKAKQLRGACARVWGMKDMHETPRMSRYLYATFYAILEQKLSFFDALHLVSLNRDNSRRKEIVSRLQPSEVRNIFEALLRMESRQLAEQVESSYNRLFEFLNNRAIGRMLIQPQSLDFNDCMRQGKIILCNLSTRAGAISREDRSLLGTLLVNEIYNAATSRHREEEELFFLYLDEFAHFVSDDVKDGLAETRKFGLGFVLAHQDLSQLYGYSQELFGAVMTNTRTKVVFGGLQDKDREVLSQELFAPDFNLKEIKDEVYRTAYRPVSEKVTVNNWSTTEGRSEGTGTSRSSTRSETTGESVGSSQGFTQGSSETRGQNETQSTSRASSRGYTEGKTWGSSETHGQGTNESRSQTRTEGTSSGSSFGTSEDRNNMNQNYQGSSQSRNQNEGRSHSDSYGTSMGTSSSYSRAKSEGGSRSNSESTSQSESFSRGMSYSQGNSQSRTESQTWGISRGRGSADTEGTSTSYSQSYGDSHGGSETWVTFHEEYQDLANRTYWSLDEHLHRVKTLLAKLPRGCAVVKIGADLAQPLRVPLVDERRVKKSHYYGFLRGVTDFHPFCLPEDKALSFEMADLYATSSDFQPLQNQQRPNNQPRNRKQRSKNTTRPQTIQTAPHEDASDDDSEIPLPEI